MADSEKHPIKNGIITAVCSGLILAGLLYFIPKFFVFVQNAISSVWNYLLSRTLLPNSLLCLLIILASLTILGFVKLLFRSKLQRMADEISLDLYKSDILFGMLWKWSFINTNDLPSRDLWCFCPNCATRLVHEYSQDSRGIISSKFSCEKCGFGSDNFKGNETDALSTVIREIERRITTEEWKDSIKKPDNKIK